ncbi:MAG: hypothetical protein KJO07_19815 [Deltaproteobacteria bacterium]|nr:hypothetical protein [Deltaproteobacteria bacterium]
MRSFAIALTLLLSSTAALAGNSPPAKHATHLVMVWEDAPLFRHPNSREQPMVARRRVMPRARRPFLLVGSSGQWVRIQSFSTADIGRTNICPMPGLADVEVHLYVRKSDIAETISLDKLPKKLAPAIEYRLDGCRNPNASAVTSDIKADDPMFAPPDLEAPPQGFGPYLEPSTPLTFEDGSPAGQTRFSVALPLSTTNLGMRTCFRRSLVGALGLPTHGRSVTLCADNRSIKRR